MDVVDGAIVIKHKDTGKETKISYSSSTSPAEVDWSSMNIEIVMESSGVFLTRPKLQPYFDAGVKKVVVSAPVKDKENPVLNVVYGVNHVSNFPRVGV